MSTVPPGPKRSYPGSLLLQFRRDPLGQLQKIARKHGDIVNLRLGRENVYRPAGPAVCKTRQARLRRSMAPRQAKPVRTPIASSNPLPGPATGAHRSTPECPWCRQRSLQHRKQTPARPGQRRRSFLIELNCPEAFPGEGKAGCRVCPVPPGKVARESFNNRYYRGCAR